MVIGAFPAAKLGVLAIKQISKPIANVLKSNAKNSPFFRKYICMPPAQMYNWVEVKTKMWALNLGRPVTVPPLNEAMAIELGANLLGEFIIFVIGAGLLIVEYARQSKNETKKQEALRMEKADLMNTLNEMGFRLERQDAQLREVTRVLADMDSRSIFKWTRDHITEYRPFDPEQPDQSPAEHYQQRRGHYDPDSCFLFRALHALERQFFYVVAPPLPSEIAATPEPPVLQLSDDPEALDVQPYVINPNIAQGTSDPAAAEQNK